MTSTNITPAAAPKKSFLSTRDVHTQKRNTAEKRFRLYGMVAVGIGLLFLIVLLASILRSGIPAFTQTVMNVELVLTQEEFDEKKKSILERM